MVFIHHVGAQLESRIKYTGIDCTVEVSATAMETRATVEFLHGQPIKEKIGS